MEKTIVFDFDGSLVDSWPVLFEIFNKMAEKHGFKKLSEKDFQNFKRMDARELLKAYKISPIKALKVKREGTKLFAEKSKEIVVFKGMLDVLNKLKKQGCKLGVLTFSPKKVVYKVIREQELDVFDFIYCVPGFKSKKKTFKRMLREQKIKKEELIYVGDEIRDVELAREFGVKGISVAWGYNTESVLKQAKPDLLISSVSDLYKNIIN